jgi:hypothetical protein
MRTVARHYNIDEQHDALDTDAAAIAEARARWSARSIVHVECSRFADGNVAVMYFIGDVGPDLYSWRVRGQGMFWAAAFADADRQECGR